MTAAAPVPSLDEFVRWYKDTPALESVVGRVEKVYSTILPGDFGDDDLRTFLQVLYGATLFWRPRNVVQTGTFVGSSSIAVGIGLKENALGELFTIDPEPPGYFGIDNPVDVGRRAVAAAGVADRVRFVRGYSTIPLDARRMKLPPAPTWRLTHLPCAGAYDLLVVDGDHTLTGCLMDLEFGARGLASDGPRVIVVHDYLGIPDVGEAVRKWSGTFADDTLSTKIVPSRCGIALIQLAPGARSAADFEDGDIRVGSGRAGG